MLVDKMEWTPRYPSLRPQENDEWKLCEEVFYEFDADGKAALIVVPAGYVYDGASVPRFFWRIAGHPMDTETVMASLLHDYCFTNRPVVNGARVTFEDSADLYEEVARRAGSSWITRKAHKVAILSPFARALWNTHNKDFA